MHQKYISFTLIIPSKNADMVLPIYSLSVQQILLFRTGVFAKWRPPKIL